eukprot:CAMPEP_0117429768 /NCGR_PEP_ID=MMETSP0758-20121206/9285_1 /TAXON_ID=63605 /ORGANISM="Percolomonas cosmopolitus, Strain AE-1 (ATCC 50343)" /LENGTH=789 /DNA_ID=CAMNT_0005217073 /DNA_START=8 /DNA_END=2377 /DNA_ORIENTATION=+
MSTWEDEWDAPTKVDEEDDEFFDDDELENIVEGALNEEKKEEEKGKKQEEVTKVAIESQNETNSQASTSTTSTPRKRNKIKKKNPMDDIQVLTPKRKRKKAPTPTMVDDTDNRSVLSSASSGRSSQKSHDEEIVGQRTPKTTESGIVDNSDNYKPPPELNDEVKTTYSQMIRVFGDYLVRLLCSPNWKHREQGIQELGGDIESGQYRYADSDSVSHFKQVCLFFAKELLNDKVIKVYFCALELIQFLCSHLQRRFVEPPIIKQMIQPILSTSMKNLSNSNSKHTKSTIQFLFWCSQQPSIGIETLEPHVMTSMHTCEGGLSKQATYATNRLNLLIVLVNAYGIHADMSEKREDEFAIPDSYFEGFSVPTLLTLALDALTLKSTKTRDAAALLITKMYSVCGEQLFTLLSKRLTNEDDVKFLKLKMAEHSDGELQFHFKQKMAFPLRDLSSDDASALTNDNPVVNRAVRVLQAKGLRNLLHPKWAKRAAVFKQLEDYLSQYVMAKHGHDISDAAIHVYQSDHFEQLMQLVNFGLSDANPKVMLASMSLFRVILHNESIYFKVSIETDIHPHLIDVVKSLYASGLGSSNRLCRESALQSLLALCERSRVGGVDIVSTPLFEKENVAKNISSRTTKKHLGELSLLHDLVQRNSIEMTNTCFHVDNIMTYVVTSLSSKSGDVREAAMSVIIEIYKKAGNVIMAYLSTQKPALIRELKSKVLQADRVSNVPLNQLAAKLGTTTPQKSKKSLKSKILEQSSPTPSFSLGFSSPSSPSFGSPSTKKPSRKNRFVFS